MAIPAIKNEALPLRRRKLASHGSQGGNRDRDAISVRRCSIARLRGSIRIPGVDARCGGLLADSAADPERAGPNQGDCYKRDQLPAFRNCGSSELRPLLLAGAELIWTFSLAHVFSLGPAVPVVFCAPVSRRHAGRKSTERALGCAVSDMSQVVNYAGP